MNQLKNNKEYKQGIACAILCATLWGILPIYWKSLYPIDSMLIIFYRIVLVGVFSFAVSLKLHKWKGIIEPLKQKGIVGRFLIAGLMISTNWSIYVWAVSTNHIIQTSIGYYIEPLLVCLFGVILFKEKLNKYKIFALILASCGVLIMILYFGQFPFISLSLAITFATYAAIKKKHQLNAVLALLYETMFLVPIALIFIVCMEIKGIGVIGVAQPYQLLLLSLAGIITGIPLMLFAMAANRISMIALGLTEYISPSLGLLLGVFVYQEPFEKIQIITFIMIWIGLAIFTLGEIKESKVKD